MVVVIFICLIFLFWDYTHEAGILEDSYKKSKGKILIWENMTNLQEWFTIPYVGQKVHDNIKDR